MMHGATIAAVVAALIWVALWCYLRRLDGRLAVALQELQRQPEAEAVQPVTVAPVLAEQAAGPGESELHGV